MNLEIGAQAALFPEKEYISGIFVAVCEPLPQHIWLISNEQTKAPSYSFGHPYSDTHTTKKIRFLYSKKKKTVRPLSQFQHSCICGGFVYYHDRSTNFPAAEKADLPWEYINQT
jgi:hypothetical protein